MALSESYIYFSDFSLTADIGQIAYSKYTLGGHSYSVWNNSALNRNLCSWKKKTTEAYGFMNPPQHQDKARTKIWAGIMKQLLVQCQLKDFFQCQMHLEYGGQKWRYLYGVPELWWNLLVIYSWRLPSSWSCVANRQQLPTPFPTWAVCAKRIGSSVEISSREWKLTITYC